MSHAINTIRGILNLDGTLKLDEAPSVPAGPVEVTIRPLADPAPAKDWWEVLQQIRADREASGHRFRTKEEIDADLEDMRDWDDDRTGEVRQQGRPGLPTTGPA